MKGATLTSISTVVPACPVMWQGIEVWGDPSRNHTVTDQPFQGHLSIELSIIQHAHIGVLVGRRNICAAPPSLCKKIPFLAGYGGGIVTTATSINSEIRNCATGIYYVSYNPASGPGNVGIINNSTKFLGGTLLDLGYTTGNFYTYPGITLYNPPANTLGRSVFGVYDWNVSDVTFDNLSFDNIERAIVAFDTRFDVTNSLFNNHLYGMYFDNTNSNLNRFHNVSTNTFFDNIGTSVFIRNGNFDWIDKGNIINFNNNGNQPANAVGVFLESNTSRYQVLDNTFNYNQYGVIARNSGAGGGFIGTYTSVGNTFNNVNRSVRIGLNFSYNNNYLTIRCNKHFSPDPIPATYSSVWHKNGFMGNQGSSALNDKAPAGNEFNTLGEKNLLNFSGNNFIYYYHAFTSTTIPTYGNAFGVLVAKTSTSCTDLCPPPCFICCRVGQFNLLGNQADLLEAEYDIVLSNLDNGQGLVLLAAINANTPPGELMNLLIANSPLSDQVLLAFVELQPNTPPGIFNNVMLKNLPVSDDVWNKLRDKIINLPPPFQY